MLSIFALPAKASVPSDYNYVQFSCNINRQLWVWVWVWSESINNGCWKYALCHEESLKNSILVPSGNWGKGNSSYGEI